MYSDLEGLALHMCFVRLTTDKLAICEPCIFARHTSQKLDAILWGDLRRDFTLNLGHKFLRGGLEVNTHYRKHNGAPKWLVVFEVESPVSRAQCSLLKSTDVFVACVDFQWRMLILDSIVFHVIMDFQTNANHYFS